MDNTDDTPLDLDAYLGRIDFRGDTAPTLKTLEELHLAHATHVPFENLDILLGKPIRLDLASLQAKLVTARRGGYCFEQNALFGAVLGRLGFDVTPLAGRVRIRGHHRLDWAQPEGVAAAPVAQPTVPRTLPRTHMALLVNVQGKPWIADVGFGREGLLLPVPLEAGAVSHHFAWRFRIVREGELWVLQSLTRDTWYDMYSFTLEPQHRVDYEMANYYVSTHPDSRFTQTLTVQRPTPEARYLVRNFDFAIEKPASEEARALSGNAELLKVLRESFGLEFDPATQFRIGPAPVAAARPKS